MKTLYASCIGVSAASFVFSLVMFVNTLSLISFGCIIFFALLGWYFTKRYQEERHG